MSNLSDLLQAFDLIEEDANNAITKLGAVVGTIADFAGAVPSIISAVEFVASLFGESGQDPTQTLIQTLLNTIVSQVKQLRDDQKAADLLTNWRALDAIISSAEGWYETLSATLEKTPPVTSDEILNQIHDCLTAVITLSAESYWNVVYDDMIYFLTPVPYPAYAPPPPPNSIDPNMYISLYAGGGLTGDPIFPNTALSNGAFICQGLTFVYQFEPVPDSNSQVFSFIYILPYFIRAIILFLAVGAALDPQFVQGYSDAIRQSCIEPLQHYHDKIKEEGIVNVVAPTEGDMFVDVEDSGKPIGTPWSHGWEGSTYYPQPYGALNLFSGYCSIGSYPPLNVPPMNYDDNIKIFSKYLLRSLARSKEVYRGIGLPTVWNTLNRMKSLVGDPPLQGPCFGDWSLQEVFSVLGYPKNQLIGRLTIRDLTTYLENISPTFTFGSAPISLRQMLEGLPLDQTVSLP